MRPAAAAMLLPLLAACATTRPPGTFEAGADLAIRGVTVVDVAAGTLLPDRTVLVHGNRIVYVDSGAAGPSPPASRWSTAQGST